MFRRVLQWGGVTVVGVLTLAACASTPASRSSSSIDPPAGERLMALIASGVQTYTCEFDAQHRLQWVFKSPLATLYDTSGHAVVNHAAGPSWQASDGSRIVGHAIAQLPSDTKSSVPQLLLETHSTAGSGTLSTVRYVQRVKTVGGVAPAAPCSAAGEAGSSPYLAEYVFYK